MNKAQNLVSEGMDGLSARAVARLRDKLQTERRGASARLDRALRSARSQEDTEVGDLADQAAGAAEQSMLLVTATRERALIRDIDRALDKIDRGEFGLCEGTGEPIERRRLEVWPWARFSCAYLELVEGEGRSAHRHH
jgi:DnaK suppressor protein